MNKLTDRQEMYLQEIHATICDLLEGKSYEDVGHNSRDEMLEEFKFKLEHIVEPVTETLQCDE